VHIATLNCTLAKSRYSAGDETACRSLLNREEGIDLRLPRKPQGLMFLWRNAANPGQWSQPLSLLGRSR